MVEVDAKRCTRCGLCLRLMKGYCISEREGMPVFDATLCNLCQKCVAICPGRAIMVNGVYPDPIRGALALDPADLISLYERRRSTKHFQDRQLPRQLIEQIVAVAKYAPNQNKNITLVVIDDAGLLADIEASAMCFVRKYYRLLFSCGALGAFFGLFARNLPTIKRKMEHDLLFRQRVLKDHTQALIIATGSRRTPVTEQSAPYLLATMMYMAETLGVGTCLLDSLTRTLRSDRALRKRLGIRDDALAVMALGYSAEHIVNIPRGYEVDVHWNS